ncbi:hypothetical protein, partial [Nocardia sp. NPDC050789]
TGTPLTGWEQLDRNPATVAIAAGANKLYQLHETGAIFRYTGTPLTGWEQLDRNPATVAIAATASELYQLHETGATFRYTGTPFTGWSTMGQTPTPTSDTWCTAIAASHPPDLFVDIVFQLAGFGPILEFHE